MTDEQHDIDDRPDSIVVEGDDADHVLPLALVVIMIVSVFIATPR